MGTNMLGSLINFFVKYSSSEEVSVLNIFQQYGIEVAQTLNLLFL